MKYLQKIHYEIYGTILGWLIVAAIVTVQAYDTINKYGVY
jgi:uncharacterized membrane protein